MTTATDATTGAQGAEGTQGSVAGLLGTKLGMTQVWDEAGRLVPVTVVEAGPCVVTQLRTAETDGYTAVQIAFGSIDPRKVNKPQAGHFTKAGTTPRRHVVEIRTADASTYEIGAEVPVDTFAVGEQIDVTGTMRLVSSKTWVIPSFSPRTPWVVVGISVVLRA